LWKITDTGCTIRRTIADTAWTVTVDPETNARQYSGKNKINYSTPSLIKLDIIFVGVLVKNWKISSSRREM